MFDFAAKVLLSVDYTRRHKKVGYLPKSRNFICKGIAAGKKMHFFENNLVGLEICLLWVSFKVYYLRILEKSSTFDAEIKFFYITMRKIVKEVDPRYQKCPIRNVIDKFGDKWSLLVLYNLNEKGTLRFNDLHREMADCSQKMLSQTLKRLESIGMVHREVYPEVPPRVEYSLTERGKSLMPHVSALIAWAVEHFEKIAYT